MTPNEKLKRDIKAVMSSTGTTQKALADRLGVSPSAVGNALTGDKALLTGFAVKMLDALNLEPSVTPTREQLPAKKARGGPLGQATRP